jgi:hypothetical protein
MSSDPRPSVRHSFPLYLMFLALLLAGLASLVGPARKVAALDASSRPSRGVAPANKRMQTIFANSAANAPINQSRDFAGFYKELSVTDLGASVRVSLKFKVFNYSGADVSGATVRMPNRIKINESHGSIANVSILDRQGVVLTGDFTVPRREHEQWRKGPPPFLLIEYRNAAGTDVRRMIELALSSGEEVQ